MNLILPLTNRNLSLVVHQFAKWMYQVVNVVPNSTSGGASVGKLHGFLET
jgi:hypothetical protein